MIVIEKVGWDVFGSAEVLLRNHGEGALVLAAEVVDAIELLTYLGREKLVSILVVHGKWVERIRTL